jgi:AraC-like DNA-binding protein
VVIDCTADSLRPVGSPAFEAGMVAGIAPAPTRMSGRGVECLELELDPMAAGRLLGVPLTELSGPIIDLRELWGRDAVRLRERLVEAGSWDDRFAVVREALAARQDRPHRFDREVADAWRVIVASGGRVRVSALAERYGWSRTKLWSRFKNQVGVTPKRAATITRFDHALRLLGAGAGLSEVAAVCGYADQPHLSREVLQFTGRTPGDIAGDPLWQLNGGVSTPA